ncbi:MAG: MAPEG family protein [Paracoccaceae bacterium]|nr:MAPEG family protein [Paracoccaceae bacterium]
MTIELTVLILTALLAASLWIPYIVGVNSTTTPEMTENRPMNPDRLVPWVHRAFRAHLNLLEQFLPFAVIVIAAHLVDVSNVVTVWASVLFLVLRLVHAAWMITGMPVLPARPLIFTAGWLCILAIAAATLLG